ncbi:unnamed protein product, partial [Adineta steineri]
GRTIRHGNGRFHDISGISWKQYSRRTNSVTRFIWFGPEPTGTCQNWQPNTVTSLVHRIPGICWADSAREWRVSLGISADIHGILLQEPSSWDKNIDKSNVC